jgi:hypothetical protein
MNKTHFGYQTVDEAEKAGKVADVFHSVANKYDVMNDLMSFGCTAFGKNSPSLGRRFALVKKFLILRVALAIWLVHLQKLLGGPNTLMPRFG